MDQQTPEQRLGESFVSWYYDRNNNNKQELVDVYTEESLITFQDFQICGLNPKTNTLQIMDRLINGNLATMTKKPNHVIVQPSVNGTYIICVQGNIRMSEEEIEELGFIEIFVIGRDPETNGFLVQNQIFSTTGV